MNKKIHKTGTTILLALAPAAALGITTGIIVNNLTTDAGKEVTADEWFKEYKIATDKFQSTIDFYSKDDVEVTCQGQKPELEFAEQWKNNGERWTLITFKNEIAGEYGCYLNDEPAESLRQQVTDDTKYFISEQYLTIKIPNNTIENGHKNVVFNRDGYIVSSDILNSDSNIKFEVKYLKSPYEIKDFGLYFSGGNTYYGPSSLLVDGTTYKFTINLDGTNPIGKFKINKTIYSSTSSKNDMEEETMVISDVKVTGVDQSKWEMASDNKSVLFKEQLKTGTIIVECKVSIVSNAWVYYVPYAY